MTTATRRESMEVEVPPALGLQLTTTSTPDPPAIGAAIDTAFTALRAVMQRNALAPAEPPRAIYASHDPSGMTFTLAFPIAAAPGELQDAGPVTVGPLPSGRALRFVHRGPYDSVPATWGAIDAWLRERGGLRDEADWARYAPMWEEYLGDPATTPASERVTRIYLSQR